MTSVFGTASGRELVLGGKLGRGGQAAVHAVEGDATVAVKLFYADANRAERVARAKKAVTVPRPTGVFPDTPDHVFLTWPSETVFDESGAEVGFVMPRLGPDYYELRTLNVPEWRVEQFQADWAFLVTVAANLARLLSALHASQIVVGDLSPKNVMVRADGMVSLLDCDSYQFRHGTVELSGENVTVDYAAPELLATGQAHRAPSAATDDFALAIVVCELLMCGDHPFMGHPTTVDLEEATPSENIKLGVSRLAVAGSVTVPEYAIDVAVLPPSVRALAVRTFGPGRLVPDERPTAERWAVALRGVLDGVRRCQANPKHSFHGGASPSCPWCARLRDGLDDPFSLDAYMDEGFADDDSAYSAAPAGVPAGSVPAGSVPAGSVGAGGAPSAGPPMPAGHWPPTPVAPGPGWGGPQRSPSGPQPVPPQVPARQPANASAAAGSGASRYLVPVAVVVLVLLMLVLVVALVATQGS